MKKLLFALVLLAFASCQNSTDPEVTPKRGVESFESLYAVEYLYGYASDVVECEYFYNEEYQYWGGFAVSKCFEIDAAKGVFENQYSAFNTKSADGEWFLLYYYDSYSEPCDLIFKKGVMLNSVKLNLTTYTYASITDEDINTFARKFDDGDYLKVIFTPLDSSEAPVGEGVECYVVDYRDGKRFVADDWQTFPLGFVADGNVRVTIETSDVGEYGANTPLYICLDSLEYNFL
jgi:pterin-4a-carbinolamine dehydratase